MLILIKNFGGLEDFINIDLDGHSKGNVTPYMHLMAFQCSSTQLNVVNWVLRRGSAHAQTSSQLKSHKYFQGYQEPLQSYRRDHKSPSGLSGASSECNFMEKGKSADVGGKKPDEASRSLIVAGEDTSSIELSKASLEAIAKIVASKLRWTR